MTVGKKKEILLPRVHIKGLGLVFHDFKIKCNEQIRTAQRTARVTALHAMYHSNYIPTNL
jgi:hypothetical protein